MRGESALTAGLSLLPEDAVVPVASAVSGRLTGRGGTAAGLLNAARQVGGAVAAAVGGSLVSGRPGFVPGLRLALARCGGAFLLGGTITRAASHRRVRAGRASHTVHSGRYPRWLQNGPLSGLT